MALPSPRSYDSDDELSRRRLEAADEAVRRWESRGAALDDGDGVSYSAGLVAAVKDLISLGSGGGACARDAKVALKTAMGQLQEDFRKVLISGTYFHPPDSLQKSLLDSIALPVRSFSFSSFPDLEDLSISSFATSPSDESRTYGTGYSRGSVSMERVHMYLNDPEASVLLKEIAEIMILSSHAPHLCRAYGETRYETLMQCLCLLGVQTEPKGYNGAALAANGGCSLQLYGQKQKMWIQALRVIVGTVLPEERQACAEIFGCDSKLEEDCFARASTRCIAHLLAVGNAMANVNVNDQHYHKVPLLLQMHKEFVNLRPSIEELLCGDAKDAVSQEASMLLDKLGEAASSLLFEFLNACSNHKPWKNAVLDGGILPLTQHVMGFIELIAEYNDTVNLILPVGKEEGGVSGTGIIRSPWERYVLLLLACLQQKIEEYAESYEDECLRYIFLMNNAMYVLKFSRSVDLSVSLGDVRNHEQLVIRVEQYATAYLRASWTEALFYLSYNGVIGEPPSHRRLRKGMKNFNAAFGEISRVQTAWKVPNPQLRQHLRLVILQLVHPAYRVYIKRYGSYLESNPSKYIKYTLDDIENHVLDLFEG
uniref:Uncharacterized protein n=1 Tax=Avena sativa TaxID=4498 RepID=A0ACD5XR98_AVESA